MLLSGGAIRRDITVRGSVYAASLVDAARGRRLGDEGVRIDEVA